MAWMQFGTHSTTRLQVPNARTERQEPGFLPSGRAAGSEPDSQCRSMAGKPVTRVLLVTCGKAARVSTDFCYHLIAVLQPALFLRIQRWQVVITKPMRFR